MSRPVKPSGIIHQAYVKTLIDSVANNIQNDDKRGAIQRAEDIKRYLEKFSFDYFFEEQMRDSIKSVIETFSDAGAPKKKAPPTIKGIILKLMFQKLILPKRDPLKEKV